MSIDVSQLGKVAVLMGGVSAEREISLMSGHGVLAALQSRGVQATAFDPAQRPRGPSRTKVLIASSSPCMAVMVKTGRCKGPWSGCESPTPGRV